MNNMEELKETKKDKKIYEEVWKLAKFIHKHVKNFTATTPAEIQSRNTLGSSIKPNKFLKIQTLKHIVKKNFVP